MCITLGSWPGALALPEVLFLSRVCEHVGKRESYLLLILALVPLDYGFPPVSSDVRKDKLYVYTRTLADALLVCIPWIRFLPRCMKCRRGLAMSILSVCLSVCLSVRLSHACIVTKR